MLLKPGTASVGHLRESLAAYSVTLDDEALRELHGIGTLQPGDNVNSPRGTASGR
jgi:aryl-alcohol dehydrogenase-like predicted oxidoreductase